MVGDHRLRLVIFQEGGGLWTVRGLEHDVLGEAGTIGQAVRAVIRLVEAHSDFDMRHNLSPLTAFRPAPQTYWHAFRGGTPLSLTQLGVAPPSDWDISLVFAGRRPVQWPARASTYAAAC
jgi:hypothetical protein